MGKWEMVAIPDVVFFQEGPGVRNTQYTSSGVKLLNVANLANGKIDLSTSSRYISEDEAYGKYKHFLVNKGDFIIASSGIQVDYFEKKMGFIHSSHLPLCMNTSTIRFQSLDKKKLYIRFFMYCLKTPEFKEQLKKLITGSAQLNFGPSHLKKMTIPLPPLPVQQKIADVLDKASMLIEKRKAQIEKLDLLVKAQFMEMFGDPVTNPKGWATKRLETIASVGSSKRVFVEDLVEKGVPFYRGTEVGAMATGNEVIPTLFITKEHYNILRVSTGVPQIGDFLMPSICPDGRIWRVDTKAPFYFKDGRVLWVHFTNKLYNDIYLQHALKEKIITDYANIASGTTFAELKIFSLKSVPILLPPRTQQDQFANFVQQVESQKAVLQKSLKKLELNYKSLMQKCFSGRLFL